MGDREPLLRAIAANPDEDTPRLMYADLLDELGGDANTARARFIRLQIQTAREPTRSWFAFSDRLSEVSRLAGLFADQWLNELPNWAAVEARKQRLRVDDFPRGFLDTFHVKPVTFIKHGHQLLDVAPITRIVAANFPSRNDLVTFLNCPQLMRVHSLTLPTTDADLAASFVRNSRALGALEALTLCGGGLTDSGAAVLSQAIDLGSLRVLSAHSNRLTAGGAVTLLSALWLPKLAELDIRGAPEGYRWVQRLRLRFPKKSILV